MGSATDRPPRSADLDLMSWKEIADHLKVSVRTAQLWERKHGLPVRRLPGVRGKIIASRADLDAWRAGSPPAPVAPARRSLWAIAAATIATLLLATAWTLWLVPQPSTARALQDFLVVFDGNGKELWRKRFDLDLTPFSVPARPRIWVGDLDQDGDSEVLFAPAPPGVLTATTPLICYSKRGKEKWRFLPGRTVRTADNRYQPPFMIAGFNVAPIRKGGAFHVLLHAHHTHFPTQAALLANNGRMLREYWHSGFFDAALIHDIDGDGKNEIYLAGTNNARRMAELVVLDPESFTGASDESATPAYQIADMQKGVETARILLPGTCVLAAAGGQYNSAVEIQPAQGEIRVAVSEGLSGPAAPLLFYRFDRSLRLIRMETSDTFLSAHRRLRDQNLLDHPWSESDRQLAERRVTRFRSR